MNDNRRYAIRIAIEENPMRRIIANVWSPWSSNGELNRYADVFIQTHSLGFIKLQNDNAIRKIVRTL